MDATRKMAHMAITPQAEKGVGDVKRSASITSGGLVIHSPTTCMITAATNNVPVQRCTRRAWYGESPGKRPPISKGWNIIKASPATPARQATMYRGSRHASSGLSTAAMNGTATAAAADAQIRPTLIDFIPLGPAPFKSV